MFIVANSQEQRKARGVFHTPHVTLSRYERQLWLEIMKCYQNLHLVGSINGLN